MDKPSAALVWCSRAASTDGVLVIVACMISQTKNAQGQWKFGDCFDKQVDFSSCKIPMIENEVGNL
jgi:hypothetical protein